MNTNPLIQVVLLGFAHGSALVASRAGLQVFAILTWIWLNMSLASIAFLITLRLLRSWPTGKHLWIHGSVWGITGMALPSILIAMSLNHQSSGLTAVMVTMAPVFTCVIAHFGLPEERFTSSKIIGVTLSLAGVLMIAAKRETGLSGGTATSIIGLATSIVAALSGASSNVYARRFMRDFNPLHASSIRTFAGVVAITPFFIFSGNFDFVQISPSHYPPLIYSALVGYFTGNIIIFNIVKRHGASTASMAAFIMPIVALMLGALTLNEKVTLSMALGTALILLGLFFVLRQPMSKALG